MADDGSTTIADLRSEVENFVTERQWEKFHSPKNISMALSVEASELMEHFQWITAEESLALAPEKKVEVGEELADVFCYLLAIANSLDVDVASTFHRKMELNRRKYPIEQIRGRFGHDDPNPVADSSSGQSQGAPKC